MADYDRRQQGNFNRKKRYRGSSHPHTCVYTRSAEADAAVLPTQMTMIIMTAANSDGE
jgi:hypothetical protein